MNNNRLSNLLFIKGDLNVEMDFTYSCPICNASNFRRSNKLYCIPLNRHKKRKKESKEKGSEKFKVKTAKPWLVNALFVASSFYLKF